MSNFQKAISQIEPSLSDIYQKWDGCRDLLNCVEGKDLFIRIAGFMSSANVVIPIAIVCTHPLVNGFRPFMVTLAGRRDARQLPGYLVLRSHFYGCKDHYRIWKTSYEYRRDRPASGLDIKALAAEYNDKYSLEDLFTARKALEDEERHDRASESELREIRMQYRSIGDYTPKVKFIKRYDNYALLADNFETARKKYDFSIDRAIAGFADIIKCRMEPITENTNEELRERQKNCSCLYEGVCAAKEGMITLYNKLKNFKEADGVGLAGIRARPPRAVGLNDNDIDSFHKAKKFEKQRTELIEKLIETRISIFRTVYTQMDTPADGRSTAAIYRTIEGLQSDMKRIENDISAAEISMQYHFRINYKNSPKTAANVKDDVVKLAHAFWCICIQHDANIKRLELEGKEKNREQIRDAYIEWMRACEWLEAYKREGKFLENFLVELQR